MMPPEFIPSEFTKTIAALNPNPYLAGLLWHRGIRDLALLPGFLDAAQYIPTPASAFGLMMERSALRIQQAIENKESIALWPDSTPDGITTAALLWEALSGLVDDRIQILKPNDRALSISIFDSLKAQGISLVITGSLGSQNTVEIDYAKTIGLDIIIIDHHTNDRSNAFAQLNSRHLECSHPFATLPSVAIAYKLMEAVLGQEPRQLLDLVAIGLLSDFVEFVGETRYLFQISIPKLQAQANPETATRLGILRLLNHCKTQGDRATDANSGLGARIRAFCQVQPSECLALLMERDRTKATTIADQAELAHIRLLALHQEILDQVLSMIRALDLSMVEAIVLVSPQWNVNALPSVAYAVAEQFQKTTFLFSTEEAGVAKGVGRSTVNLYDLLRSQQHLLHRLNGHPNALSLSLPSENLEIFTQAIQHQLRIQAVNIQASRLFDLCVTVTELGETLFKAIRSIEPVGCNHPVPRFLVKNMRFEQVTTRKIKDHQHQPVIYRCAEFKLYDRTSTDGIYGSWWGHFQDDLPKGDCDAIVQLKNNDAKKRYEVRLLQWFPVGDRPDISPSQHPILDRRHQPTHIDPIDPNTLNPNDLDPNTVQLTTCPSDWNTLKIAYRRSVLAQQPLVLNYCLPRESEFVTLLGIAKYLARTGESVSPQQWCDRLCVSASTLQIGLEILRELGFEIRLQGNGLVVSRSRRDAPIVNILTMTAERWKRSVRHERFRQQYFMQVNLQVLQAFLSQITPSD